MKQEQAGNFVRRGECGALRPRAVAPTSMRRQFVGREVRVEDRGLRAADERTQRGVLLRVAELVIGRVDEIARRALYPVGKGASRMIERLHEHAEVSDLNLGGLHERQLWT